MKNLKLFENFRADQVKDMLEDIVDLDFVTRWHGTDPGYELDSQREQGGTVVWITIDNADGRAFSQLDDQYERFAEPFERWCKQNGLYDPNILSDQDAGTITYQVTL